jgi:hypothetical protein
MPTSSPNTYKSLDDIRARKAELNAQLQDSNTLMKTQWNTLFHKPKSNAPSKRVTTFMTTGATLFDGILLAWKLYNRFGGGKSRKATRRKSLMARILQW